MAQDPSKAYEEHMKKKPNWKKSPVLFNAWKKREQELRRAKRNLNRRTAIDTRPKPRPKPTAVRIRGTEIKPKGE